jgi:feruloyl esterase
VSQRTLIQSTGMAPNGRGPRLRSRTVRPAGGIPSAAALFAICGGVAIASVPRPAAAQPGSAAAARVSVSDPACAALTAPGLFKDMTISRAEGVQLGAGSYCEVAAVLSPVPGSKIGVVYRMPMDWNGRLVGYGGNGWIGNVALETVLADLGHGYATMQTDGGHAMPTVLSANTVFDASWTAPDGKPDDIAIKDFSWRAVHQMTVAGKQLVSRLYGRPQEKALFVGCSTGGHMGMMETQRFPADYDGVVSGAPVYSLRVQLAEIYRDWVFSRPGAALTPADLNLVHQAVLAQCDAQDGVEDGIVGDPAACRFDPASLRCKSGHASGCLTEAQVAALYRVYAEAKGPDGQTYAYAYTKGNEADWPVFQNTIADPGRRSYDLSLRAVMFGDRSFDFASFDIGRDGPRVRARAFAADYEADDPNLKPFLSRGGKLILWHGLDDSGPSAWGTVAYDARMRAATGALANSGARMFLPPGVEHCGGGPGPSDVDWLGYLDRWVTTGVAPEKVTARTASPPGAPAPAKMVVRPVCAYPAKARYAGKGDPNVESSFACK